MNNTPLKNTKKILLALLCGLVSMVNTIANTLAKNSAQTWAEYWKLHNALVLFNPAPVT